MAAWELFDPILHHPGQGEEKKKEEKERARLVPERYTKGSVGPGGEASSLLAAVHRITSSFPSYATGSVVDSSSSPPGDGDNGVAHRLLAAAGLGQGQLGSRL